MPAPTETPSFFGRQSLFMPKGPWNCNVKCYRHPWTSVKTSSDVALTLQVTSFRTSSYISEDAFRNIDSDIVACLSLVDSAPFPGALGV